MAAKKPASSPKPKVKSVHIQARLHTEKIREADALVIYRHYRDKEKWTDREIVREALIAFGEMKDQNWKAQRDVTPVTLSADMLNMLNAMSALVQTLSHMDFTSVRDGNGVPMDNYAVQQQLSDFDKSASDLLGKAVFFDVEDDE